MSCFLKFICRQAHIAHCAGSEVEQEEEKPRKKREKEERKAPALGRGRAPGPLSPQKGAARLPGHATRGRAMERRRAWCVDTVSSAQPL